MQKKLEKYFLSWEKLHESQKADGKIFYLPDRPCPAEKTCAGADDD